MPNWKAAHNLASNDKGAVEEVAEEAEVKGDGAPAEGEVIEGEEEEEVGVTTVTSSGEASIKGGNHTVGQVGHSILQRPQQRGLLQGSPCQCT